jgi:LmbE family N-acetylglucosaminyl deacetylase/CelD/BcsL family acetyltransferase involved in cellulose biosynthesis
MDVDIIASSEGLTSLRREWEELEARDDRAPYYVTHRFVSAWWDAHAASPDVDLHVVVVRLDEQLVGVAPFALRTRVAKGKTRRVLTFASHGDYLGVLVDPGQKADRVLKALMEAVHDNDSWDTVSLRNVPSDSPLASYLLRSEFNEDFTFHIENPYIDLSAFAGFDQYASERLPAKVRKYRNKFLRECGARFRVERGDENGIFDKIAELHQREQQYLADTKDRQERYSLFADPERGSHIRNVFDRTDDAVTFFYESDDGALLGYRTCFEHRGTLLSWNSAYDPGLSQYRIGKIIQFDILEHLFREGSTQVFDFGAGRYPWKFEWTDQFTTTYKLQLKRARRSPASSTQPERYDAPADRETVAEPDPLAAPPVPPRSRLARARARVTRRVRPPNIWYAPHPDDESIFMGASIALATDRDNILVMLTRGGASGAIKKVNARLDKPLTRKEFMRARVRELRAAARALGVAEENLLVKDLPDGGLDVPSVREVISDMAERHPGAVHRTMSYLDPHADHRTAGEALLAAHADGEVKRPVFYVPIPHLDETVGTPVDLSDPRGVAAKKAALQEYHYWAPHERRYAIGQHSVTALIRKQLHAPVEHVHGPGYRPAEAWHQRVEESPDPA